MSTAVFERDDVVDFLGRGDTPQRLAVFAQRVGLDVGVADFAPAVVVSLIDRRVTLIRAVTLVFCLGVCWAESFVAEFGTAWLGAGCCWFDRHLSAPLLCMGKPQGSRAWGSLGLVLLFNHLQYFRAGSGFPSHVSDTFWREWLSVEGGGEPVEGPVFLAVGGVSFNVEVVTHVVDAVLAGAVGKEERFKDEPVVVT